MLSIEQTPDELLTVDQVGQRSYGDLLLDAHELADGLELDRDIASKTFILLEDLRQYDEDAAIGGLRTMPLALETADEIGNFYGIQIDRSYVFAGAILHDIGKLAVPKRLLAKSSNGCEWTAEDAQIMRRHAVAGGQILRSAGLPTQVTRPVEEHHCKQRGSQEYGVNPDLADDERISRDAIAIADFAEADINRTNTRNRHLSRQQREEQIAADIAYIFDDYSSGEELADRITKQLLGYVVDHHHMQMTA